MSILRNKNKYISIPNYLFKYYFHLPLDDLIRLL